MTSEKGGRDNDEKIIVRNDATCFFLTAGGRGIVEAAEPTKGPQYGGILRIVDDFNFT
jgi:hypothetical protein